MDYQNKTKINWIETSISKIRGNKTVKTYFIVDLPGGGGGGGGGTGATPFATGSFSSVNVEDVGFMESFSWPFMVSCFCFQIEKEKLISQNPIR